MVQLQEQHAFELSDAHDMECQTTIGVVLQGQRVKFVIPGSPGHRPSVGRALEVDDVVLSVDRVHVDGHNIVQKVRGAVGYNGVGSKVTLLIKRASSGVEDTVVCLRAPLNVVQNQQDLFAELESASKSPHKHIAELAARVLDKVRGMEEHHSNLQQQQLREKGDFQLQIDSLTKRLQQCSCTSKNRASGEKEKGNPPSDSVLKDLRAELLAATKVLTRRVDSPALLACITIMPTCLHVCNHFIRKL